MPASHSLRGMRQWAMTTARVVASVEGKSKTVISRSEVGNYAYSVYKKQAVNEAIRSVKTGLRAPSFHEGEVIRQRVKSEHGSLRWSEQPPLAHRARVEHNPSLAFQIRAKNFNVRRQGMSARFSMVSDAFIRSSVNASASAAQINSEFYRLAKTTSDWLSIDESIGSKVMQPEAIALGRPDHAVLYSTVISAKPRRQQLAHNVSSRLLAPSQHTPLGMDKAAPGVAYGEILETQKLPNVGTQRLVHSPPGYRNSERESSSFGLNRSHIISDAIEGFRFGFSRGRSLNDHLDDAIRAHGYRADNPAYIREDVKRDKLTLKNKRVGLHRHFVREFHKRIPRLRGVAED